MSILTWSAREGLAPCVEAFFENNHIDPNGEEVATALMLAVEGGHVNVVEVLIQAGMDTST